MRMKGNETFRLIGPETTLSPAGSLVSPTSSPNRYRSSRVILNGFSLKIQRKIMYIEGKNVQHHPYIESLLTLITLLNFDIGCFKKILEIES